MFSDQNSEAKVVILGLGNILLGDEGIGIRVIESLQKEYVIPNDIEVVDGGTSGIDLLPYLRKGTALYIIDAVKPDKGPGTMIRLEGQEVPSFLAAKLSPHQIGLPDLLATAELLNQTPDKLVMLGVEPNTLETGIELSDKLKPFVKSIIDKLILELNEIGIALRKK